ncbi:Protein of unknown function [Caminicella sporogenes DSM 14501]|uniref:DUF3798 domain-containing protein n=1 Tax=Caminicella sporogenes DSM 14501 TaxID=1121266 RepID=A0A1M6R3X8_9FIRM|nr:DUF3798 domain-containing protein [Caminicella sporogenes]RKD27301.1 hypothetical protein BET04_09170 [Caminicella sporogenes]WIF94265.1 DUF3798 domain-containing protein [Caminicella sporogenes]SHK27179.1 Protein of unknown function [Caminicella sporogenes DSM 14501]
MLKKLLSIMLILSLVLGLIGCSQPASNESDNNTSNEAEKVDEQSAQTSNTSNNWKIGIMTGTVSQNEEEYRAAQRVQKKYGKEHVILMTYPDKFMDEQETTIANVLNMASDPDVKAIIIVQAVPGTVAAIKKAREIRDDILFIAGTPGEDPSQIAAVADVVFAMNELAMGETIPKQAKKQGAKVLVHYSFPRHMSYPLLAARRDLLKENCEKLGIKFVDATAPDPTGDAGVSGAQQFILEDVPRMVEKYGKDTAFFSTNCAMQVPLISACLEEGAIYPQPCCPSPYHGFPSALGIEIPEDKKGDVEYAIEQIKAKIAEKGGTGRFSTWPVPVAMMFIEAGAEYAKAYIEGKTNGKLDVDVIKDKFKEYAKTDISLTPLEENGNKYDNYLMVLLDFLDF